ncbi:hypothetical protein ABZ814_05585 [Micromonospora musae]|uniref:hypothetical protein n=1 Tax=Micromonospora musae TaxID=1894970 RepID=UPI0033D9DA99
MAPPVIFAIVAAGMALFMIGIFLADWVGQRESRGGLALRTPRVPIRDALGLPELPEQLAVEATTAAGADGPTTAQLSAVECVWYGTRVFRVDTIGSNEGTAEWTLHTESGGTDPIPLTDGSHTLYLSPELAGRALLPGTGPLVQTVVDEHSEPDLSRAEASPYLAGLIRAGVMTPDRLRGYSNTREFRVTEGVVRPGQRVLVIGRPRRDGRTIVLEAGSSDCGVTTLTDEEITDYAARATAGSAGRLNGPILVIGLVLTVLGLCVLVLSG